MYVVWAVAYVICHMYCVLVQVRVREWKYKTKKSHPSVHFHQSSSFYHLRARSRISRIKAIYKIFQTDRSFEFFIILWVMRINSSHIVAVRAMHDTHIHVPGMSIYCQTACQTFRWFTFSFSELSFSLHNPHFSHIPKKNRARASGYSCLVCTCTFHVCDLCTVLGFRVDTDLEHTNTQ